MGTPASAQVAQVGLVAVPDHDVGAVVHRGQVAAPRRGSSCAAGGVVPRRAQHDDRVVPRHGRVGPRRPAGVEPLPAQGAVEQRGVLVTVRQLRTGGEQDRTHAVILGTFGHRPGRGHVPGAAMCDHRCSAVLRKGRTVAEAGWYPDQRNPGSELYWDGQGVDRAAPSRRRRAGAAGAGQRSGLGPVGAGDAGESRRSATGAQQPAGAAAGPPTSTRGRPTRTRIERQPAYPPAQGQPSGAQGQPGFGTQQGAAPWQQQGTAPA